MTPYGPYPGRVDEVHDGDTLHITLDLGFAHQEAAFDLDGKPQLSCRVFGINAPELSKPDGSGLRSRDFARGLLPVGARVMCMSHGWDKYGGRWDGTITMTDGRDFATVMVDNNQAVKV